MKKITLLALVMVMILSMVVFAGCGNKKDENKDPKPNGNSGQASSEMTETDTETESDAVAIDTELAADPNHEHSYTEKVTVKEACGKEGEKTFTCKCGDTYTEVIPAPAHTLVADASTKVESTCTKAGKDADATCSTCGAKVTGAALPLKDHAYGKFVYNNDATQSADGTQSRTCSVCGKVDTQKASGTKLPTTPASLRAVTSLDDIPVAGTMTSSNSSAYNTAINNIKAGKVEKIRYVASNGKEFCMWNVRIKDEREPACYYWFVAPTGSKFSDGYTYSNVTKPTAAEADKYMIAIGSKISSAINESMVNRNTSIPLFYRTSSAANCPVTLYEIVDSGDMISVWVEGTNCGQAGVGTCGSFNCTGTCLRMTKLNELQNLMIQKRWSPVAGGEGGRIKWNGKLLVQYYYMKY